MINNDKLIIEFKSLAKVLSPKQRRKLIAKGSKHKDYNYIVDSFQTKIENSAIELEDIYSYVNEFGRNDDNTLDPAKLFLQYLEDIVVPNPAIGIYMGEFYVIGTNFIENMSEIMQGMKINDTIKIISETSNPYDTRAVKVLTKGNVKIGYIPKNKNHFPSAMLENGEKLIGQLKRLQWKQDEFNIKIMLYCKRK